MKPLKYITDLGALEYYDQNLVNEVISFFEGELREKIRQARSSRDKYRELAEFLDRTLKTGRAEEPVSYNSRYDRFCNYIMYVLEKSDTLDLVKKRFPDAELDTVICIMASHVRRKLK